MIPEKLLESAVPRASKKSIFSSVRFLLCCFRRCFFISFVLLRVPLSCFLAGP